MSNKIPVSVFMGYLGSGKTTIILGLLKQISGRENIVMLKNEFGDVAVDSKLATSQSVQVKEILNGCLCCVLVGKLQNALNEILDKYKPDRILFESSGTAYPASIVWEINKNDRLQCDGVVTVIDAVNFGGYQDKSYTASLQAKYTDIIVINKANQVDERRLDKVLDDVYDLNPTTPKYKTSDGFIDASLVFGLTEKNKGFLLDLINKNSSDFSETRSEHTKQDAHEHIDTFSFKTDAKIEEKGLVMVLNDLSPSIFFRIKGYFINENDEGRLLNYVFGKTKIDNFNCNFSTSEIVFMGRDISNIKDTILSKLNNVLVK